MEDRIMLGVIKVASDKEDVYREWHDNHMKQIIAEVPEVVKARRYELADPTDAPEDFPYAKFIVVYEIDGSPEAVRTGLDAGRAAGKISLVPEGVILGGHSLIYEAGAEQLSK